MICKAPGCSNPVHGKGLCRTHYMRIWRYGSYDLPVRHKPSIAERIDQSVRRDDASGCWIWTAALSTSGYGVLGVDGTRYYAHRLAYEAHVGPIADGLTIDHLCRVRRCVNPKHLAIADWHRRNRKAERSPRITKKVLG